MSIKTQQAYITFLCYFCLHAINPRSYNRYWHTDYINRWTKKHKSPKRLYSVDSSVSVVPVHVKGPQISLSTSITMLVYMYVCCSHNVRLNFLLQLLKLVATSTHYAPEDSHSRALSLLLEQWNTSKSNLDHYEPIHWAQSNRLPKPTLGPKRKFVPKEGFHEQRSID